jgi:hypothetical protein
MKKLFLSLTICFFYCVSGAQPAQCFTQLTPFSNHKGKMVSQVKMAKEYFMNSTDPAAGNTYEERTANLKNEAKSIFAYYVTQRTNELKTILCKFREEKTCTNGTHSLKVVYGSLTIPDNYIMMPETIEKTQSGDLKAFSINGNRIDFGAGRSSPGRAVAFVSVLARYTDGYISTFIENELAQVRVELNSLNLPTDLALN